MQLIANLEAAVALLEAHGWRYDVHSVFPVPMWHNEQLKQDLVLECTTDGESPAPLPQAQWVLDTCDSEWQDNEVTHA